MKLEVGMYVRTKDGIIAKCTEIRVNRYMFDRIILENGYYNDWEFIDIPKEKSLIKKASFNIIGLIEVGDVITLKDDNDVYRVITVPSEEYGSDCFYLEFDYADKYGVEDIFLSKQSMEQVLKSIVTKERFKSVEYEV